MSPSLRAFSNTGLKKTRNLDLKHLRVPIAKNDSGPNLGNFAR